MGSIPICIHREGREPKACTLRALVFQREGSWEPSRFLYGEVRRFVVVGASRTSFPGGEGESIGHYPPGVPGLKRWILAASPKNNVFCAKV
jgi:hypothetical protein